MANIVWDDSTLLQGLANKSPAADYVQAFVAAIAQQEIQNAGGVAPGSSVIQTLNFAQYPNFTLTTPVTQPSLSRLYLRGVKQTFGTDYVFQSSTILQWVGAAINFPNPVLELYS